MAILVESSGDSGCAEAQVAQSAHVDWLRDRFAALVAGLRPASVLDVGCGAGAVLARLRRAGIDAQGLDDRASAAAARALGLTASTGDATALPCADGSFDVVAMRHVPHHLADPRSAFAEAARVACQALVLAEPWFDESIPSQRLALEVDLLVKRLHERRGRVHRPNLSPEQLASLLPAGWSMTRTERWFRLAPRPLAELDAECLPELDAVGTVADRAAYRRLRERIARDGWSRNGSCAVVVGPT